MKLLTLFLVLSFALLWWIPNKKKTSFCLATISSEIPYKTEHPSTETQEAIRALSQSYHYLKGGGQCYAFISQDQNYVIKFFKQKAFSLPPWIERFPLSILFQKTSEKKKQKKERLKTKIFSAFELSLEKLPEETGMLYVHLSKTNHLHKTLTVRDAKGNIHLLNLDDLEFVVQRKAELAGTRVHLLMQNKETDKVKQLMKDLLLLTQNLHKQGFQDKDKNFLFNYGFIQEKAAIIDVGKMIYIEPIQNPNELRKEFPSIVSKFRNYLIRKAPTVVIFFDEALAEILQSDLKEPLGANRPLS